MIISDRHRISLLKDSIPQYPVCIYGVHTYSYFDLVTKVRDPHTVVVLNTNHWCRSLIMFVRPGYPVTCVLKLY